MLNAYDDGAERRRAERRGEAPCPFCGEAFTDSAAFRAHVEASHGADALPRESSRGPARAADASTRFRRWVHGLGYLPLWFVLPVNACLVVLLVLAWKDDLGPYLVGDPTEAGSWLKTWILRLSLLPTVLVLTARVFRPGG